MIFQITCRSSLSRILLQREWGVKQFERLMGFPRVALKLLMMNMHR
jgi:hypothetical protein